MNAHSVKNRRWLWLLPLCLVALVACAGVTPAAPPPPAAPAATVQPAAAQPTAVVPAPTTQPTSAPAAPTTAPAAGAKKQVVLALDSDIDKIEPMEFRSDAGYYATANLYEPLLAQKLVAGDTPGVLQGQGEYGPGLAEVTMSPDGLVATAKIKQGAKFANGDPITAQAFKTTFDRAITAERSYIPLLVQFMGFSKADQVVVKDDYTLEFHLEKPSPLFVPFLAFQVFGAIDPATVKENATTADPWAFDKFQKFANASGPYILTKWESGVEYDFAPNPNYWQGPDFFQNSGVVVKVVPSAEDRELLLKKGDIDLALGLPFKDIDALKADPNVKIYDIKYTRLFYLGMNNKIKPFDNPKVRQAISYAVPYDTIIKESMYGYAQKATSPIPVGMPTHNDSFWNYNTDTTKADALFKEAGLASGTTLDLSVRQSVPQDADAAVWIQSSLAKIGVTVNINKMTDADFFDKLNKHQLPFFIHDWYSWGNDPAYQLTFLLKCGAFTNYADYCNQDVDKLIDQVVTTVDPAERQKLMDQAQKIIIEEAPWAFLYQPDWVVGVSKNFAGFAKLDDLCLRFAYMSKQ